MLSGKKSLMSMVLALLLLCGAALAEESTSGATALTNADYQQIVSTYSIDASIPGYADYLQRYEDAAHPDVTVTVDADTFVRYEDAGIAAQPRVFEDYEGMAGKSVLTGEESLTEWVVDVPESGLYDLTLLYYPYAGKNSAIQRAFFVDGKLPYSELAMVDFNRVWVNGAYEEYTDENGIVVRKWDKDNQGNDLKPSPIEQPEWCAHGLYDTNGYISGEMSIYLEAGQHTLTLLSMREPMLLRSITLSNHSRPAAYADVKAAGDAAGHQDATGVSVRFEAENAVKTSSQMLYPVQDQSSAVVYPMSARYLLNNSIGSSWKNAGQWIEWAFEVPQDGYYEISMVDKQNFVRGIDVYRKIMIDGEVPFAEFNAQPFSYTQTWRIETLSDEDGNAYRVYLTAGKHTLRMEVVLGDMANIIAQVQDCVQQLNNIYRQVIYITGVAPDQYRDYQLTASLPKLDNSSWWESLAHETERLYYSFIIDYNKVGNVAEGDTENVVLTLWIGTGRDQANVIKSLIDEKFTPATGISVNVQLVDMNTLLRATLAGEGPDVAIQVANTNGIAGAVLNTGNDTPVNYGLRNAVLDLTQFEDFPEIAKRFNESAIIPFSFDGATYALPDTQTWLMMFYRKDILAEIGLEVPQTWDEVKVAMSILSKNQMEFGMLPSEQVFAMLLFQNGGRYYTDDNAASALDEDVAINVFKKYCEYYTDYKLDKETSAEERFRTGECPIIISDYTTYNNLQVSAPDILGLWDFTTVPGTVQADGSIDRSTGTTGLADIIMSATKHPDESWEFLKWWTSTETQTLYGREMESLMGASARVATANTEALANLSWPMRDYRALVEQMQYVRGIPQVPGGYYTWRNINNAFYTITTDTATNNTTPREALMDKVYYINAEINYKRTEFGLPLHQTEDTTKEE